jgi:hypothetical protein
MQDGLPAADRVHMTQIHLVTTKMTCNVYILAFASVSKFSCHVEGNRGHPHISRLQNSKFSELVIKQLKNSKKLTVFITKCGYMFRPIIW